MTYSEDVSRDNSRQNSVDDMKKRMVSGERQISITSNRPATTILATDHMIHGNDHHVDHDSKICGLHLSGNAKTLLISTILFLSITTGQYFAAIIANSVSLKADCVSMLVDALSYIGNLFAECTPNPRTKKRLELVMSGVSLSLLLYFTTDFILESYANISHVMCYCGEVDDPNYNALTPEICHEDGSEETCTKEDEVNAYIVMFFALGGLLFDGVSLFAYWYYAKDTPQKEGEESKPSHHHHIGDHPLDHRHGDNHEEHRTSNVNMMSALMHVFSDLMRSTTTLVESLILFNYPNVDGVRVDGWCALIVCSLIAFGALWSILVWLKEVYIFCNASEDDDEEEDLKRQMDKRLLANV